MKIKMKTTMAGPNGTAQAGQVIERPEAEAYDLIERGYAEQVGFAPPRATIETTALDVPETTAAPRPTRRKATRAG